MLGPVPPSVELRLQPVAAVFVLGDICLHVLVSQALLCFSGKPQGKHECWAVECGIQPKMKVNVK